MTSGDDNISAGATTADPYNTSKVQVQVPAGMGPGTQMQIPHPTSGQPVIVTVPPDAKPGGVVHC